jgi:glycine/D-amino acid oxidase-like deaminating enzyme
LKLRSQAAFWPIEAGLIATYPSLKRDETCDVAIIGAGVTGALMARRLSQEGLSCAVVDAGHIGGGSTSASTALVQYEIDQPLCRLAELRGMDQAVRAYQLCAEAVDRLRTLAHEVGAGDYRKVPSLYLASDPDTVPQLEEEFRQRREHGFDVLFLSRQDVAEHFPFSAPAALWTEQAGQLNPYRFAHALLADSERRGARIYDRAEVENYASHSRGVTLTVAGGRVVEAKKVVFATGYHTPEFLDQKIVTLKSTYAFISEPQEIRWHRDSLIWETSRPYLYLRLTPDGRVIVGGEDENFKNAAARDALIPAKTEKLQARFQQLFPEILLEPAYAWAGTFGETNDGLGYIGETPEFPHGYFALGYGGNGITYSVIATDILSDLILGRPNADAGIFRFGRGGAIS